MTLSERGRTWTDHERLAFLLDAAREFGRTLDGQQIHRALRGLLERAMPLDGLIVSSYDAETEQIRAEYVWSDGKEIDVSPLPLVRCNRDGTGMQSQVIRSAKAAIFDIEDKVREPNTSYIEVGPDGSPKPLEEVPHSKSAMMAPLMLEGHVAGVVQAMSDNSGAYSFEALDLLEAIALQMAPSWHHARLFSRTEDDRKLIDRIVHASPDLVYIFDLRVHRSTFSNNRLARILGFSLKEFAETPLSDLMHPDDYAKLPDLWTRFATAQDGEVLETEYRVRATDGSWRWILNRDTPFERDDSGRVVRVLGFGRDITRRKALEEELERRVVQRTEQLEAAVKELEGFTYSVSHDLRAPLRAINAASMILREDYADLLPEEAQTYLLRQAEAAKKMSTLIDELLKLSRIGRQQLEPSVFDLSLLAEEVTHELGGDGRVRIEPKIMAHGDPRLVRFVLLNLIDNALKFSDPEDIVRVGQSGDAYHVSDDGVGFEMQYAEKLFRPFERLVRDDEYPGTGIGLANAQRIVQRHGGKIWAESDPGKGSTFFFTLPRS